MNIVVKIEKHKKFKDKELYFEIDNRETGEVFQSSKVCIDNDDIQQLQLELSSALGNIIGQI